MISNGLNVPLGSWAVAVKQQPNKRLKLTARVD
jgi:hypothetical protein